MTAELITLRTASVEAPKPHPGRVGLVKLVQHDDRGAPVVVDQPPEVGCGTLQRVQGHDEGGAPCVALQRKRHSEGPSDGSEQCLPEASTRTWVTRDFPID